MLKHHEEHLLSPYCKIVLDGDVYDGEVLETTVRLDGVFVVHGDTRREVVEQLKAVVERYQI